MIRTIILEDELLVRLGLKMVINWEKEGYCVVGEGKDGLEGIQLYEELKPDLIITDIRMPKLDGIEMMRQIREKDHYVQFVIISGCDDFILAKEAISLGVKYYCLKGTMMDDELTKILNQLRVEIEPMIRMRRGERKEYIRGEELENYFLDKGTMYVLYSADEGLEDILRQVGVEYVILKEGSKVYIVICLSNKQSQQAVIEKIKQLLKGEEQYVIGCSKEMTDVKEYKHYLRQAILSAEQQYFIHSSQVVLYNEMQEKESNYKCQKALDDFYQQVMLGQYERGIYTLREIEREVTLSHSVRLLHRVLYRMAGIMGEHNKSVSEVEVYQELLGSGKLKDIFEKIVGWINELNRKEKVQIERTSHYIKIIKEYIKKNYEKNIRIKDIADEVHLSTSYLGKLFYLETEIYLKDYITKIRLEKAKKLLETTSLSVSEVACQVGIEDANYFSKVFKKHYSISPSKYVEKKCLKITKNN